MIATIQSIIGTTPDGKWGPKSHQALSKSLDENINIPISKNITLNELIHSNTAKARKIDNIPPVGYLTNLINSTINLWQPARDILGNPMIISSGYRCYALNKAINGSTTSAHSYGYAIDFKVPGLTTPQVL